MATKKVQATVFKIGSGFVLARDEFGEQYFIWHESFSPVGIKGISDCEIGTVVNLMPVDGPKGLRGIEVDVIR